MGAASESYCFSFLEQPFEHRVLMKNPDNHPSEASAENHHQPDRDVSLMLSARQFGLLQCSSIQKEELIFGW